MKKQQPDSNLKIAIIGYGKMGRMVEQSAPIRGHTICSIIDPKEGSHDTISKAALIDADVCIDFTHPETVLENIRAVASHGKNLVVGTTGWGKHLAQVEDIVKRHSIGLFYEPNFAIGMNIFYKIVAEAAKYIDRFEEYDVSALDYHHNQKVDSPSGAATIVANILKEKIKRKKRIVTENLNRKIEPDELQVLSLRCGSIPGVHEVIFDSPVDTIKIQHTSRNRQGFAMGAVKAAEWIIGKQGVYTMDDLLA